MEKNDLMFEDNETTLRPKTLCEYVGQENLKEMLNIYIQTAKMRQEALDHCLLYGPPGLGKTTMANIIANEMGAKFKAVSAPSITRTGDLAAILSSLEAGDVLFIDEIHRLPKIVEEILYSAMEDFSIDIIVGRDATAQTIKLDLPPFTLIGATTRCGDISSPLRDRFGIVQKIDYYKVKDLQKIVKRTSNVLNFNIDDDASFEIAKRSRGTPRIANRLFRRVRDFAQFTSTDGVIKYSLTSTSLTKLRIDEDGLNETDHKFLKAIIEKFKGGPVGLSSIASSIGEEVITLEDVYEPYLLQMGFIIRTPRGRMATDKAYKNLNIERKEK